MNKGMNTKQEISIGKIVHQEFSAAKAVVDESIELRTPKGARPDNLTKVIGFAQGISLYVVERGVLWKSPAQISRDATNTILWQRVLKNGKL